MYYLFLDESGDLGDFNGQQNGKGGSSRFFTVGGIIVDENNKLLFEENYRKVISAHFNFNLPSNFKLHYKKIRNARFSKDPIYKKITGFSKQISDCMFCSISNIDCKLLSVTIDIQKHCKKYKKPIDVLAYALYLILERFQYFLVEYNQNGKIVYERYNAILRHKVEKDHMYLNKNPNFPKPIEFLDMVKEIENGDPTKEPMLSFVDFFTYAPWKRCESLYTKNCRYDEIKHKYYNFDHYDYFKKGNYEI